MSRPGFHLGGVRDWTAPDLPGRLRLLATIGYREVELGTAEVASDLLPLRRLLDASGLAAPSRHVRTPEVFSNWRRVLADCRILGSRQIVCDEVPASERASLQGYRRVAALLNSAGRITQWAGVQLVLRAHLDDLRERDRVTPYDFLLANTTPALVKVQMDLSLMTGAGRDPLEDLRRYRGRFASMHLSGSEPPEDLGSVLTAARQAGVEHFFVADAQADPSGNRAKAAFESVARLLTRA